jgi:hypothetical protein
VGRGHTHCLSYSAIGYNTIRHSSCYNPATLPVTDTILSHFLSHFLLHLSHFLVCCLSHFLLRLSHFLVCCLSHFLVHPLSSCMLPPYCHTPTTHHGERVGPSYSCGSHGHLRRSYVLYRNSCNQRLHHHFQIQCDWLSCRAPTCTGLNTPPTTSKQWWGFTLECSWTGG